MQLAVQPQWYHTACHALPLVVSMASGQEEFVVAQLLLHACILELCSTTKYNHLLSAGTMLTTFYQSNAQESVRCSCQEQTQYQHTADLDMPTAFPLCHQSANTSAVTGCQPWCTTTVVKVITHMEAEGTTDAAY